MSGQPNEALFDVYYRFRTTDGGDNTFKASFGEARANLVEFKAPEHLRFENPPEWTALKFCQCPSCPLDPEQVMACPLASSIAPLVSYADGRNSIDKVAVSVQTPIRTLAKHTDLQEALRSLMGLLAATSGCPRTRFLRPLARFHLPFSDFKETLFRIVGMHLVGHAIRQSAGKEPDFTLERLKENYEGLDEVNRGMSDRLRCASGGDASLNSVVILDTLAKRGVMELEDGLASMSELFGEYVK